MTTRTYLVGLAATVMLIAVGLIFANVLPGWINGIWAVAALVLGFWFGVKAFKFAFGARQSGEKTREDVGKNT